MGSCEVNICQVKTQKRRHSPWYFVVQEDKKKGGVC